MNESELLAEERKYLLDNADALRREHGRQYLLIKGPKVQGVYETYNDAVRRGAELFGRGPFLVRSADRPEDPVVRIVRPTLVGGQKRATAGSEGTQAAQTGQGRT